MLQRVGKEKNMTRGEHLICCKKLALEYIKRGDVKGGWLAFFSDMKKHPATANHTVLESGMALFVAGELTLSTQMNILSL